MTQPAGLSWQFDTKGGLTMKRKVHSGRKLTESQFGFLLALPALAVFGAIILYPLLNSFAMGFTNQSLLRPGRQYVGLLNFERIFLDPNILQVFVNTFVFVACTTAFSFSMGFIWAMVLNQGLRGSELLRGITLVNWIIPGTAIGFLWMWIFNGQYGVLNALLRGLGLIQENITWLGRPGSAMAAVVIARAWQTLPWYMAFLLAGLQAVPYEQVEAARIDGASNFGVFTRIVLPNMKFIIFLILILGVIGNLQHFDIIWVMTQGGPAQATTTLAVEVYRRAFQNWELGVAAAIGVLWVLLISIFAFFYIRDLERDS